MGTRIGCVASEKGAAEKERRDVGGGLGLRMQTTTNDSLFTPPEKMMMYTPHHDHHHDDDNRDHGDDDEPPTLLTATGGGFGEEHGCQGGDSRGGPFLCNNTSNTNTNHNQLVVTSMSDIYDVVGGGGGAAAAADSGSFVMPLPPKSLLFSSSDSLMSHNSCGIVVPFTAAQRQELERQTLIYKYMMASVPVPPQLLVPISKTTQNFPHLYSTRSKAGGSLEMGVSSSTDLEPWRCRRTDGKKWRCSRNVVPDQKYCERHSHKSRPRSRKPVEQQQQQQQQQQQHQQQLHSQFFNYNNTDTNTNNINTSLLAYPKSSSFLDQREKLQSPYSSSSSTTTTTTATSHDQTRGLEWFMMKGEEANSNQAEWHQVVHVKPPPQQGQGQERAFGFYGQYQELQISQGLSDGFGSLIDPKLVPNQTRHIIDAWSMTERDHIGGEIGHHHNNKYAIVSSNDKVPYSSLSLSMQGGNGNGDGNEESENSHMGFGIEGDLKRQWLNNNNNNNNNIGSWNVGSSSSTSPPPGGPLAEALCLGMAGSARLTTSPRSSS